MQLRKRAEKQLVEPTLFKKGPRKFPHLAGIPDLLAGTYIGPFIPSHAQCCNRHFWLVVHKKNNSVLEIEENWLNFNLAAHSFPLLSAQEKSALDSFLANNKDLVLRHEAGVVTSTIESFHSACLKHFSKKVAVSSWSWELRVNMARLEWNHVPDWRKRVRKALLKRWKKRFFSSIAKVFRLIVYCPSNHFEDNFFCAYSNRGSPSNDKDRSPSAAETHLRQLAPPASFWLQCGMQSSDSSAALCWVATEECLDKHYQHCLCAGTAGRPSILHFRAGKKIYIDMSTNNIKLCTLPPVFAFR